MCKIWLQKQKNIEFTTTTTNGDRNQIIPKEFVKGLSQVNWPGRAQSSKLDKYPGITWFFDGAHTLIIIIIRHVWTGLKII